jgi:hypothetical protein
MSALTRRQLRLKQEQEEKEKLEKSVNNDNEEIETNQQQQQNDQKFQTPTKNTRTRKQTQPQQQPQVLNETQQNTPTKIDSNKNETETINTSKDKLNNNVNNSNTNNVESVALNDSNTENIAEENATTPTTATAASQKPKSNRGRKRKATKDVDEDEGGKIIEREKVQESKKAQAVKTVLNNSQNSPQREFNLTESTNNNEIASKTVSVQAEMKSEIVNDKNDEEKEVTINNNEVPANVLTESTNSQEIASQQQQQNHSEPSEKQVDETSAVAVITPSITATTVTYAPRQQQEVIERIKPELLAMNIDMGDENAEGHEIDDSMSDSDDYETDEDDDHDGENKLNGSTSKSNSSKLEKEKQRRRLPVSIKELIDYHSSNGKSIKEIVNKINQVCKPEEKVSYGYVQKYLYRKKLEATTAKKARYYRKKYGFVYRRMRRKPVLTEHHRSLRMQWCENYKEDRFDMDIFIGKTALKPFLASLNQLKGQQSDPNAPKQQTTLHLWGAISRKGASPLQVNNFLQFLDLRFFLLNLIFYLRKDFRRFSDNSYVPGNIT